MREEFIASQCSQRFSLINYSKHPEILNNNLPDNRELSSSVYSSDDPAQQHRGVYQVFCDLPANSATPWPALKM